MTAEQDPNLNQGPLAGVRVVDLTSMISGPVATMMLADQGADVIKVEALDGDLVRGAGATRRGITSTFISSNRSKRALAVDLKTPEGVEALEKLKAAMPKSSTSDWKTMTRAATFHSGPSANTSGSTTKELRVPSEKMTVRRPLVGNPAARPVAAPRNAAATR